MTIKERVERFAEYKEISVREFERLCNIPYSTIGNAKTSLQPDKLLKIYRQFPELNLVWLLIEEEQMIRDNNSLTDTNSDITMDNQIAALNGQIQAQLKELLELRAKIDFYEKQLGGGFGSVGSGELEERPKTG